MSETIIIQKKKKQKEKKLTIEQAINILKPFVVKWKRQDEDMANKMYEIYKQCENGEWGQVLNGLGFPSRTWYDWCEHFGFELNFPNRGHDNTVDAIPHQDEELSDAEQEDKLATEYDTIKYQEVSRILSEAQRLTPSMFKLVEKEELIKELQTTIKKLNGLLLKLESGLED